MDRFENLPDDVRQKLKTSPEAVQRNKVLPADVAEAMLTADKPIWTPKAMHWELGRPASKGTVRDKMDELVELEFFKSRPANQGEVYWWNHDKSDWPLPPDIEVEPANESDELTVREAIEPAYVKIGIASLLVPSVASIFVLLAIFALGGSMSLPISAQSLLSVSLIAIFLSYAGPTGALVAGLLDYFLADGVEIDIQELR